MKRLFAGIGYDGENWKTALSWSGGDPENDTPAFPPTPEGHRELAAFLTEKFRSDPSMASRVILVKHPPLSDRLYEALIEKKLKIIPVTPHRLALHRERMGKTSGNSAELAAVAASTGIDADVLLLEMTNICNLRCLFCTQDMVTRPPGRMESSLAMRLIEEYAGWGVGGLAFHVMGEPSIHPDLPEIIALAAGHGIHHTLVSNGTRLDYRLASTLFQSGLSHLMLSLQTCDEEQHDMIKRPKGDISYEQLQSNVKDILRARRDNGSCADIEIHIMDTSHYAPRGAKLLSGKENAREALRFWHGISKEMAGEWKEPVFAADPDQLEGSEIASHIWPWGKYDVLPGVHMSFRPGDPWQQNFLGPHEFVVPAKQGGCPLVANEHQVAVLCNGDVVLCCLDFNGGTRAMNIRGKTLREAAAAVADIRERIVYRGELPFSACRRCLGIRIRELQPEKPSETGGHMDQASIDYAPGAERDISRAVIFGKGEGASFLKDYLESHGIRVSGFLHEKGRWLGFGESFMDRPVWHYSRLPPDTADMILFPADASVDPDMVTNLKKKFPGMPVGQVVPLFRTF